MTKLQLSATKFPPAGPASLAGLVVALYDAARGPRDGVALVIGALAAGFFAAVVCAYACTEFLLAQLDRRRRMHDRGVRNLLVIVAANLMSFAILWGASLAFLIASETGYYLEATLVCMAAQAVWLGQHLWAYYRDHPRLRYER